MKSLVINHSLAYLCTGYSLKSSGLTSFLAHGEQCLLTYDSAKSVLIIDLVFLAFIVSLLTKVFYSI